MTLQQVDEILQTWQERLTSMAEDLLALQGAADHDGIFEAEGTLKAVQTEQFVASAVVSPEFRHGLFRDFEALRSVVDQAAALRKQLPAVFGGAAKAREIQRLLFSPSVSPEAQPQAAVSKSGAKDLGAIRCTPEQLFEDMRGRFEHRRAGLEAIERARAAFDAGLLPVEAQLQSLRSQRVMPSALLAPALDLLQETLAQIAFKGRTDPSGGLACLRQELEPALARVEARVQLAAMLRRELAATAATWERVQEQHRLAVETAARCAVEVRGNPVPALVEEAALAKLSAWRQRLDAKFEEGAHEPLHIGVKNWRAAAETQEAQDRCVLEFCRDQEARRKELAGRLEALRAKALLRGLRGKAVCRELEADAKCRCTEKPVDLLLAQAAVTRFETYLQQTHFQVVTRPESVLP